MRDFKFCCSGFLVLILVITVILISWQVVSMDKTNQINAQLLNEAGYAIANPNSNAGINGAWILLGLFGGFVLILKNTFRSK